MLAGLASIAAAPAAAATPDRLAYMQARAAEGDDAPVRAAARYAEVLAATPGDATVAAHAYRQAIAAGDVALALRAAAVLGEAAPADAALLALAVAARDGDRSAADAAIARIARGSLALFAAPLRAWAAHDATPALAAGRDDPVGRRLAAETRALILIAAGAPEGLPGLRAILRGDQASEDLRLAAARLLVGAGKREAALTLLAGDTPTITAMRRAVEDGAAPGARPGVAFGASLLFARIASDLALGPAGPIPIVLAQAALVADPSNDRARLLLADALARSGATARALTLLEAVPAHSPYAAAAAAGRIEILASARRLDEALAAARPLAVARDAPAAALRRYADLLMTAQRPKEAAPFYARALDREGDTADWAGWLQYGGALDEAGDWRRAEPALARAVELAPDQPVALNYLAYARLEHGAAPGPARALLERAARLAPDDAAITDSLGWAWFRAGDIARAIPLLERAAAAAGDNAEIGEHLGDAYWAAGRRFEARYAWRAAQVTAEPADVTRLAAKIADGPARR